MPTKPFGSDVVVICSVAGAIVRGSVTVVESTGDCESVNLKVKGVELTAAVGVPVIAPVDAFSKSPAGNVPPVSVHVYGVVPPLPVTVAVYGMPTEPVGKELVEISSSGGPIDTLNWPATAPAAASETSAMKLKEPVAVGLPVICPELESASPGGSPPLLILHLYGPAPPDAFRTVE